MTSKWVRTVCVLRYYSVEWRLISLRLLNAEVHYESTSPPEYEAGHTARLRLFRVIAPAPAEHGPEIVGPLYEMLGREIWETPAKAGGVAMRLDQGSLLELVLRTLGLPSNRATALDGTSREGGGARGDRGRAAPHRKT